MKIEHKDATIVPTGTDEDFPGTFEVILSTPDLDRDGDILASDEWLLPLPDRITFDIDHGMTVESTIGSGAPSINEKGQLVVSGEYSSLDRAQNVRTLANEGHIDKVSVAFITHRSGEKGGKQTVKRELLNGAFVAIPANNEAKVLVSKSGARNSKSDAQHIQSMHDSSVALGAGCAQVEKSFEKKDAENEDKFDSTALISGVDAAIDEAINLFATVDISALPAEIAQGIALIQAADATIDELLDVVGIPDPDEDAQSAESVDSAVAEKSATAEETKPADVADLDAINRLAADLLAASFVTE